LAAGVIENHETDAGAGGAPSAIIGSEKETRSSLASATAATSPLGDALSTLRRGD
jgi:hypothetical protein